MFTLLSLRKVAFFSSFHEKCFTPKSYPNVCLLETKCKGDRPVRGYWGDQPVAPTDPSMFSAQSLVFHQFAQNPSGTGFFGADGFELATDARNETAGLYVVNLNAFLSPRRKTELLL